VFDRYNDDVANDQAWWPNFRLV